MRRWFFAVWLAWGCGAPTEETPTLVSLNEVRFGASAWVELHNPAAETARLGGWTVEVGSNLVRLPDDAVLAPGAFRTVAVAELPRLAAAGSARLFDGAGSLRSELGWSADQRRARAIGPAGDGGAVVLSRPTPMAPNALPVGEPSATIDGLEVSEVGWDQYAACVQSGPCRAPLCAPPLDRTLPVTCVSWHDAAAYCGFVGRRLPTAGALAAAADGLTLGGCDDFARPGCEGLVSTRRFGADVTAAGIGHLAGNATEWVADAQAPRTLFQPATLHGVVGASGGYAVPDGDGMVLWFEEPTSVSSFRGFRCADSD